jgi:membrane-bound lytic murein transglycosylase MltF
MLKVLLSLGLVVLSVGALFGIREMNREEVAVEKVETVDPIKEAMLIQHKEEEELGQYIYSLMNIVNANLSDTKKQITTRAIIRVTFDVLEKQDQRKQFATLLAIESKFNNSAKSPVGATGISQIMPQYSKDFAQLCGIKDYTEADIVDLEINLYLGACLFRALLESPSINNNVALALVAYNAGKGSKAFDQLKRLSNIENTETSNYVAKFTYLRSAVSNIIQKQEEVKTQEAIQKGK